jgi:hypothetical protein
MNPGKLPDLPPDLFGAFQVVERTMAEAHAPFAKHSEAQQALNMIFRSCVESHAKLNPTSQVNPLDLSNGASPEVQELPPLEAPARSRPPRPAPADRA